MPIRVHCLQARHSPLLWLCSRIKRMFGAEGSLFAEARPAAPPTALPAPAAPTTPIFDRTDVRSQSLQHISTLNSSRKLIERQLPIHGALIMFFNQPLLSISSDREVRNSTSLPRNAKAKVLQSRRRTWIFFFTPPSTVYILG